jgi:hypothetical protein
MPHSMSYSHVGAPHQSRLRPIRAPGLRPCPFWCDVIDTPWSKAMRDQIVAAPLASGPGVPRTWRFHSRKYRYGP